MKRSVMFKMLTLSILQAVLISQAHAELRTDVWMSGAGEGYKEYSFQLNTGRVTSFIIRDSNIRGECALFNNGFGFDYKVEVGNEYQVVFSTKFDTKSSRRLVEKYQPKDVIEYGERFGLVNNKGATGAGGLTPIEVVGDDEADIDRFSVLIALKSAGICTNSWKCSQEGELITTSYGHQQRRSQVDLQVPQFLGRHYKQKGGVAHTVYEIPNSTLVYKRVGKLSAPVLVEKSDDRYAKGVIQNIHNQLCEDGYSDEKGTTTVISDGSLPEEK